MSATPGTKEASTALSTFLTCVAIAVLTLVVFLPVRTFEFQAYDDQRYVASNPAIQGGLTREAILWAFATFHVSNWHPLTWMSHMLDVQLYGMNAGAHHLTNLYLHIANSILLLLVLRRMTGALWRSAFVAALFAVHPMHVESVAWIAERKDVLSALFFLLTLWAYARYAEKPKVQGPKSKVQGLQSKGQLGSVAQLPSSILHPLSSILPASNRAFYWLSVICFALGLLSKPMLVTLPFLLLLLDYWPLARFGKQDRPFKSSLPLILEKVPFFLLAAASCLVTFMAQNRGGSVASLQLIPLGSRIANALAAYAGYLEKLVWPVKLAVLYLPQPWPDWYLVSAGLGLAAISLFFLFQARQRPYLIVGWLWFLGTLVPVSGLVQVGSQYMADRYSYLPFIGCFICLAWSGWDFIEKCGDKKQEDPSPLPSPLGRGEGERSSASEIPATGEDSQVGKRRIGMIGKTISWAGAAVVIVAAAITTRNQLEYWRTPESLFRHCIAVTSNNYIAYSNLGAILVNQHKFQEAKPFYTEALRINSDFADAVMNMGTLLALEGDLTNAMSYLQKAVQLTPESAEAYGKLGVALAEQGRMSDAIACYRESVRLKPDQVPALNNLAWTLATYSDARLRNGPEAVRLAEHACQLTAYREPMLIGTLAAAYAEAGRFSDATNAAQQAISLATAAGQKELAGKNRELMELYIAGIAYHERTKQ